jgi:hypothetical protein
MLFNSSSQQFSLSKERDSQFRLHTVINCNSHNFAYIVVFCNFSCVSGRNELANENSLLDPQDKSSRW